MTLRPEQLARLDALSPALRELARTEPYVADALTAHVRDGRPLDAMLREAHVGLVRVWRVNWWVFTRPRLVPPVRLAFGEKVPCPWEEWPVEAGAQIEVLRALSAEADKHRGGGGVALRR